MFTGDDEVLVPGAVRGYRTWRLHGLGLASTGVDYAWSAQPQQALCLRESGCGMCSSCREHSRRASRHGAPSYACTCGFYGWYHPDDTRIVDAEVSGVIEASGRLVLGSHGFRAERARVLGLLAAQPVADHLAQQGYRVFTSREAILEAFPPQDMSGLVQHDCDDVCLRRASGHGSFVVAFAAASSDMARRLEEMSRQLGQVLIKGDTIKQAFEALAPSEPAPPESPRDRALRLRRDRGTGPAMPPLGRRL